jgi:uncharacterized membrane protein
MNQAHWHLVLNHLPIIIPLLGFLAMVVATILRSEIMKRTAYAMFVFGALCTIPAFATGEGAEEIAEDLQGVNEQLIKTHEEIADTFAIVSYVLGAVALLGLWANWKQKSFAHLLSFITIAVCAVVLVLAKQTGTTGGEIRHTEIRADAQTPTNSENEKEDGD